MLFVIGGINILQIIQEKPSENVVKHDDDDGMLNFDPTIGQGIRNGDLCRLGLGPHCLAKPTGRKGNGPKELKEKGPGGPTAKKLSQWHAPNSCPNALMGPRLLRILSPEESNALNVSESGLPRGRTLVLGAGGRIKCHVPPSRQGE